MQSPESADAARATAAGAAAYSFRPSLLGAGREFTLTDAGLGWTIGARKGCVSFGDIRRVRMSFRPVSMQSYRFVTEVWAEGTPKLEIVSSSWKSMLEQERLDGPYSAFIAALHRRLSDAGAAVRFEHGANPLLYWPGFIVFAGVALGLALLAIRALQEKSAGGALFIAVFFGLFLWQGGNFFRRNRPGRYRPDALPVLLIPRP